MAFLKRKKDKEDFDEEDELEEKPVRRKVKSSDFKDLKPENKKKRKTPPKPWGKFERTLIILVLAVTALISVFLGFSSRIWRLPSLNNLKVPSVTLPNIWGEETIIIERKDVTR